MGGDGPSETSDKPPRESREQAVKTPSLRELEEQKNSDREQRAATRADDPANQYLPRLRGLSGPLQAINEPSIGKPHDTPQIQPSRDVPTGIPPKETGADTPGNRTERQVTGNIDLGRNGPPLDILQGIFENSDLGGLGIITDNGSKPNAPSGTGQFPGGAFVPGDGRPNPGGTVKESSWDQPVTDATGKQTGVLHIDRQESEAQLGDGTKVKIKAEKIDGKFAHMEVTFDPPREITLKNEDGSERKVKVSSMTVFQDGDKTEMFFKSSENELTKTITLKKGRVVAVHEPENEPANPYLE